MNLRAAFDQPEDQRPGRTARSQNDAATSLEAGLPLEGAHAPDPVRVGAHETPIDQMIRLFNDHIGSGKTPTLDEHRRIRLDDLEMEPATQDKVRELWGIINTENLNDISDWAGFKREFRQLFGFEVEDVDYETPVEINRQLT